MRGNKNWQWCQWIYCCCTVCVYAWYIFSSLPNNNVLCSTCSMTHWFSWEQRWEQRDLPLLILRSHLGRFTWSVRWVPERQEGPGQTGQRWLKRSVTLLSCCVTAAPQGIHSHSHSHTQTHTYSTAVMHCLDCRKETQSEGLSLLLSLSLSPAFILDKCQLCQVSTTLTCLIILVEAASGEETGEDEGRGFWEEGKRRDDETRGRRRRGEAKEAGEEGEETKERDEWSRGTAGWKDVLILHGLPTHHYLTALQKLLLTSYQGCRLEGREGARARKRLRHGEGWRPRGRWAMWQTIPCKARRLTNLQHVAAFQCTLQCIENCRIKNHQ